MGLIPTSPAFWGGALPGQALQFNGVDERLIGAGVADWNNGNPNLWSYEIWVKRTVDNVAGRRIFDIFNAAFSLYFIGNESLLGGAPTNFLTMRMGIVTNGGANVKHGRIDILTLNTWVHIVAAFVSGLPGLTVFVDGVDTSWPGGSWVLGTNAGTVLADGNRDIVIGADASLGSFWNGRVYQYAFWSGVALDATAALSLFQNPRKDRRRNFGNYSSSSVLSHYYMPALNPSNLGKDYGSHVVLHDLSSVNMDASNLVADAP